MRRIHLRRSLIPNRPKNIDHPDTRPSAISDLYRAFNPIGNYDEDLVEFDRRLEQHLRECRPIVLGNALAAVYSQGVNRVAFVIQNLSDESLENVGIVAEFDGSGMKVTDHAPTSRPMPPPPAWPTPAEEWGMNIAASAQVAVGMHSAATPLRPGPVVKIDRNADDRVTMRYEAGHIGPNMSTTSVPVTIVVTPEVKESGRLDFDVTVYARNRRGSIRKRLTVEIDRGSFPVFSAIDFR